MMQHGYMAYPNNQQSMYPQQQQQQQPGMDQKQQQRGDSVPEPKKARYENMNSSQGVNAGGNGSAGGPTKVVSLRNIPNDTTDLQMVLIGLQFGEVVSILYIKAKGQALIEFSNIKEANDMIQYFHHIPEHSSLKGVEAAHSSYQQLTIDNNRAASTLHTIQLAKQLKELALVGGDNVVIKAQFTNVVYPICIDALYQIFSKSGNVLKIILIQKNDLSALIQMKDSMQAQTAISTLNGRNMYNSYGGPCNILNLTLSRHRKLDVVANNSKTWDYTNPLLPLAEPQQLIANGNGMMNNGQQQQQAMLASVGGGKVGSSDHPLLPMPMNMAAAALAAAAAATGQFGMGPSPGAGAGGPPGSGANPFQPHHHQGMPPGPPGHHHHHHHGPQGQSMHQMHQHHHHQMQTPGGMHGPPPTQQQLASHPYSQVAQQVAAQSVTGYPIQAMGDTRPAVVQVANFPEQIANPDALFTLFGVYGDILKVKIMFNRRDNALMQFKAYDQAISAVQKMNGVKLFDKVLAVNMSKFPEIQIPIKNDGGLAKDYSTSPLHRFKKPGSKNFFNIFPPNISLHLSNISPNTTQEQVVELFSKYGTIKNFKWISKEGSKMALIELTALEEAVMALISLHNYQLNGSYLRVNFAK